MLVTRSFIVISRVPKYNSTMDFYYTLNWLLFQELK